MDSINRQQPENNRKDLQWDEALEKIKELTDKASTCFFCTNITSGKAFSTRPMSVQKLDENGIFWFLSAKDSNKNAELQLDSSVQLLFQGSNYSDFLNIYGTAVVSDDKEKIKELWQPILKTWFTEGIDDPRISVISVDPAEGYYWDTKHNMAIGLIKRVAGAIVGKTLDDSIEGTITL
ncbi:pyridoxamine 5'-phosphate oxidase family protein [Pinibacter soli]|uniref:Pyridoxamine 5'-phosphate oxidase family protein n=1 Tax=Pinibacter soli TaxID=3044211 RepID=A0ABT6RI20_9BACT|nr:pyridoxamine 5'-phosphate oxidase family protein [Pinibacter soli]MDI3321509.1 pyridoxamine 5'-phosphate oxidase family protein [Pinibacter soli]